MTLGTVAPRGALLGVGAPDGGSLGTRLFPRAWHGGVWQPWVFTPVCVCLHTGSRVFTHVRVHMAPGQGLPQGVGSPGWVPAPCSLSPPCPHTGQGGCWGSCATSQRPSWAALAPAGVTAGDTELLLGSLGVALPPSPLLKLRLCRRTMVNAAFTEIREAAFAHIPSLQFL